MIHWQKGETSDTNESYSYSQFTIPFFGFLPLWHFRLAVVVVTLSWAANMFWPVTTDTNGWLLDLLLENITLRQNGEHKIWCKYMRQIKYNSCHACYFISVWNVSNEGLYTYISILCPLNFLTALIAFSKDIMNSIDSHCPLVLYLYSKWKVCQYLHCCSNSQH